MAFYITEFKVRGFGSFPLDMLRYDSCFPQNSNDAFRIGDPDNKEEITLVHYWGHRGWRPTFDRWKSFLWSVDPNSVYERRT